MSLLLVFSGIPRTQGRPKPFNVSTAFSRGHGPSLAKLKERTGTWYQDFPEGKECIR